MIHLLSHHPSADLLSPGSSKFNLCRYQEATGHCAGAADSAPRICKELFVVLQLSVILFLSVDPSGSQ
jgi:hypothetical protein